MLDATTAQGLADQWHDGWNREDLATIMSAYAPDVVFSSPFVVRSTGDPAQTTIEGRDALEAYIADALARRPGIRYTLRSTFVGTTSLVIVYTVHLPDGTEQPGADLMRVNDDGKVVEWLCHYDPSWRP